MDRQRNTNANGGAWTEQQISAVWEKGYKTTQENPINDSPMVRFDVCGDLMKREKYGNREFEYGWEIDHINPVANGGSDDISNLQPLQWKNNLNKSDKLNWCCGQ
jgi:hypothetical protein